MFSDEILPLRMITAGQLVANLTVAFCMNSKERIEKGWIHVFWQGAVQSKTPETCVPAVFWEYKVF